MGTVRNFEDLVAWQKARILTREIYQVARQESFSRDYGLKDQICRASVSVMSNIAEGFDREFSRFCAIFIHRKGIMCRSQKSTIYRARRGVFDSGRFPTLE